jgi:hypothetical protein
MKNLKLYKMLDMNLAYNEKTNNYFLIRDYEYGSGTLKKYYRIYSEYKEFSHLIFDFNKYMKLEFIDGADYVENSLMFSQIIEESSLTYKNELDILKTNLELLESIGMNYIIIDLELIKFNTIEDKLKELARLYLIHSENDIKYVLNFKFNLWHNESIKKLASKLKEFINKRYELENLYHINMGGNEDVNRI